MHRDVDARHHDLDGEQRLGQVLGRVRAAQRVGTHGSGEHDGHLGRAELEHELVTGLRQAIRAVHDDDAIVALGHGPGGASDEVMVLVGHLGAVLVHERDPDELDAAQVEGRQHHVEDRDVVGQDTLEFVVGLLDRSAGRNECDSLHGGEATQKGGRRAVVAMLAPMARLFGPWSASFAALFAICAIGAAQAPTDDATEGGASSAGHEVSPGHDVNTGPPARLPPLLTEPTFVDGPTIAGEPSLATSSEGLLGTLLVLASGRAALPEAEELALGEVPDGHSIVRVSSERRLDVHAGLPRGHEIVYLGVYLHAEEATTLYALVGASGSAVVSYDGAVVGGHEADRLRGDQTIARLDVSPGRHRLVLRLAPPRLGRHWLRLRFLDAHFRAGTGAVTLTLGPRSEAQALEHAQEAVGTAERHVLVRGVATARVELDMFAGGFAQRLEVTSADATLTLEARHGVYRPGHMLELPFPRRGALRASLEVGDRQLRLGQRVVLDRPSLAAIARAEAALASAPEASRAPLSWRRDALREVVRTADPDRAWRTLLIRDIERVTRELGRGRDPFAEPRGYQRMAYTSRLDGVAQPYELFVPRGYRARGSRSWPLVITLHGFKGNAGDYFRNTFGLPRDYDADESLEGHGRHGVAPTAGPMIVIAPRARGKSMYRHAGEVAVLEALEDARRRFRVDPRRIYITGGSMGGTGAAYLPFRHPDLFAAAAPLAGYHDQRVRQDTEHTTLSELEQFLRARRSDVDWTESALHLPMLLVRGTRDRPLAWTRTQVRRLEELGYRHEHREPELGHNVWTETYADGAIFRWFARHRRPSAPRSVRLRTARERTKSAYWVTIDRRAHAGTFAEVEATLPREGPATVRTEGVAALTLTPGPPLVAEGATFVALVDSESFEGRAPLHLVRDESGWRRVEAAPTAEGFKRPGVSGPIRDVYLEPLTFVVGTTDPTHTLANRLTAEHWAHPQGWIVDYPIVEDHEVTEAMIRERTLVLIGSPRSNALHARWRHQLPIQIDDEAVQVGDRRYEGPDVGVAFVAPCPDAPQRSVLVIAGTTPIATLRSLALPDILPDYAVFDASLAPARGKWSASGSGAHYLEAGLFGMDWSVPTVAGR